ncbi:MAG: chloride channel protein [Prevotellaceae bacterium]|nr:chloride channel protein [Prevotellaceae bacterium]
MILWRENKVKQQHFVIALSLIVGIATAIAAICLKHLIHFIHSFLANNINIEGVNYLYLAFPAVGILLASLFVRFFIKDDISHGITKVLYAISQRKARIKPHNMWSSVVASTLTIGFGGSVGAEAPIVLTGSAIGSNLGRFFKMDQKVLMLMIGCGAAGAIGAIFNAPIAGFVFTLEVLMIDLTMSSIIPLLVASVTATSISYLFMGPEVMFKFQIYDAFNLERIPYLIVLGVVCGFVSLYFIRGINSMENIFRRIKNPYSKLAIGGATLSILIFLLPALYGEGYASISELLNENPYQVMEGSLFYRFKDYSWVLFMYLGLTLLFKIVATSATNGAGGTGGTFAPSLFVGCLTGYLVAMLLNTLGIAVPERNFAFAGMAGVISGVMHAPLTGIFLIAEITNGYSLFMSLMITSVVAYITINLFESHSIYAMRLAKTGELITHNKDKAVLTLMKMDSVIERDLMTVDPDMSFGSLVKIIPESQRNIFPVVNKNGVYLGEIQLDEIKNILFRQDLYHRFNMRKLMISPPARIYSDYSMEKVMKIFNLSKAWYLPVIDKQGHYLGHISQTTLFNAYRRMLVQFSDE